jgi:N-acetylglucosamine malate deacetylase 2
MKIIFIFAHPDDETFSNGGTISKLTKNGHTVKLITATKGEAGEPGNPPITTKENIGKVREQELLNAAKILGISQIFFLGFIDGTLKNIPQNKLQIKIMQILNKEKPDVVITFDKTGASNHPDHIAISKAATASFTKYMKKQTKHIRLYHTANPKSNIVIMQKAGIAYNAFGKTEGTADEYITTRIDISQFFKYKVKALKCHKTQHQDWERYLKREFVIDLKTEYFQLISENNIN